MTDFEDHLILRLQSALSVHDVTLDYEDAAACISELLMALVDRSDGWYGAGDLYAVARVLQDFHRKCPFVFSHTRAWCGNPNCRES